MAPRRNEAGNDERVSRGTAAMLVRRREILAQGAVPVGWKVGFNIPAAQERLGIDAPLAGFLTSDGLLSDGDSWPLGERGDVVVECEVAVEVAEGGSGVAALMPALELTDPPDLSLELEQILAGNIFHRALALGPRVEAAEPGTGRILVNGEERHALAPEDTRRHLEAVVEGVARRLRDAGEGLLAGDRVITGVLAPPHAARPGDTVRLELEALGGVELNFSA